jgi:dimethylaniline monooxygenase (N-oxide forming)
MKIAVIGSGVSGIAAAKTLGKLGHQVTIFDRSSRIGGVWAEAYPGVHLQVLSELYCFTDFPWPFKHADYPSAAEVMRYIEAVVAHFKLDIRLEHEIVKLHETIDGWSIEMRAPEAVKTVHVDAVIVATGNYTGEKSDIATDGRERFAGEVVTQHEIGDFSRLAGKRVIVVGAGKSGIDMVTFALEHASEVHHVFREARWMIPAELFGMATSRFSTRRITNAYNPSWVHPDPWLRWVLKAHPYATHIDAALTGFLVRLANGFYKPGRNAEARARLRLLRPNYPMYRQFRGTLVPPSYYPGIASGAIMPHRSTVTGFTDDSVLLADGSKIACDIVIFAIGYKPPALPFLPEPVRSQIAAEPDGAQLYRHIVHPRLKRLAFIGFNHNPMHIPTADMSSLWTDAVLRGDLLLPSPDEMEASTARISAWKRANTLYEPTRGYFVGTHLHNYLDVLLGDLGLKSQRKRGRIVDAIGAYTAADYRGIIEEYAAHLGTPRKLLPFDT